LIEKQAGFKFGFIGLAALIHSSLQLSDYSVNANGLHHVQLMNLPINCQVYSGCFGDMFLFRGKTDHLFAGKEMQLML
jgi:hypothetical protein